MAARRFLWIIAVLVILVIGGALAYRLAAPQLMRAALVPSVTFAPPLKAEGPDYADLAYWEAHPELPDDPARWTPEGYVAAPKPGVAVFYVTPTAYLRRDRWNMPFDDAPTNARLDLFLRSQASVFNGIAAIYAPRYRQATFGAFLTDKPDAAKAIDLAYQDVQQAFDAFLARVPTEQPIILAAHSQGALHLMHLLRDRVAGTPIAERVVAAYVVGWPISIEADMPALGLPSCTSAETSGCLMSWQSFADPADPSMVKEVWEKTIGLTGAPRLGTFVLCTNPLLGGETREAAPSQRNLGSLVPNADYSGGTLVPGRSGATCVNGGTLDIGPPPEGFGDYVLPGNNYHVYDYALFWANLRADAEARVAAYAAARAGPVEE